MQALFPQQLDSNGNFDAAASMRRIGGPIVMDKQRQGVQLRILVDHSAVEVYTGAGEALTTRFESSTDEFQVLHLLEQNDCEAL